MHRERGRKKALKAGDKAAASVMALREQHDADYDPNEDEGNTSQSSSSRSNSGSRSSDNISSLNSCYKSNSNSKQSSSSSSTRAEKRKKKKIPKAEKRKKKNTKAKSPVKHRAGLQAPGLLVRFLAPDRVYCLIWGLFPAHKRLGWGAALQPEQTGDLCALKHKYHPYRLKYPWLP